jgi:N-carbamoyl-L-amino-acid hydrolase
MHRREFAAAATGGIAALGLRPGTRHWGLAQPLRVNADRLLETFAGLRRFGATADGGVERLAYSDADLAGRAFVTERMRQAGLDVRVDTAGNLFGRRAGRRRELPPILMGSHLDSVPDGGAYDGNVGSLGALEAAWTMHDANLVTDHPIDVVVFQNEEGGLFGSEALAGRLGPDDLARTAQSGFTLRDGVTRLGGDPDRLAEARRAPGSLHAYLELHIEQGGILEAAGQDIGVVEGIVGIEQWDVTVTGVANHAGTTPMPQRRDALVAAARFVEAVNRIALTTRGRQVATVGQISAHPGAPNVVPGEVRMSLEIRDLDAATIQSVFVAIRSEAEAIASASGTTVAFRDRELKIVPAPTNPDIRAAVTAAARDLGLTYRSMPSGAGHDAQSLAPLCPIGMIFVPSVGGISHSPREFTKPEDVVNGANVLLGTALAVDRLTLAR